VKAPATVSNVAAATQKVKTVRELRELSGHEPTRRFCAGPIRVIATGMTASASATSIAATEVATHSCMMHE
jgi:hypothetical protein